MKRTTTVIIGAGQSGLAMSHHLSQRCIDHVLLERGEVANSWRTERWDSLRLLTPNWQSRLPDYCYDGSDPEGYMSMPEVIRYLDLYARKCAAPVQASTTVSTVQAVDEGYIVSTDQGEWRCRTVVVASGACNTASIPKIAEGVPSSIYTLTPMQYRNPDQLADGGVLIVGASATGVQLAREIQSSGRQVTLAVGEHVRVPRTYRGRDIKWWMDVTGVLDMTYSEVDDIKRARRVSSLQLAGSPEKATLDLNTLMQDGIDIVGRLAGVHEGNLQFSGSLGNMCALADLKMGRMLDTIDEWVHENAMNSEVDPSHRFDATRVPENPRLGLDLHSGEVKTVLWATGYRPDYSWLQVPVYDRKGAIQHDGGVVSAPGMYVMGLPFLRRRKSSLIDGAGDDARDLADHMSAYLSGWSAAA